MTPEHDARERRCPRLGHEVRFAYCRTQAHNSLCSRICDCWWEQFDVERFLRDTGKAEQLDRLLADSAKPKVLSLVELIDQAKKNASKG